MRFNKSYAIWLLALLSFSAIAQNSAYSNEHELYSDILNEQRAYQVHVPSSYKSAEFSQKDYPVAYVLDGEIQFLPFVGVVNSMSSGGNGNFRVPELIIVGITNVDRFRDFTPTKDLTAVEGSEFFTSGGGTAFLEFLEKELIPDVESKYRIAGHRLLVGHSLGGLLAVQGLIEKPELFQSYSIVDPSLWWDGGVLLNKAESSMSFTGADRLAVSLTTPIYPDDNYQITSTASLQKALESLSIRNSLTRIPNVDHGSVPLFGFYNALSFLYGDFQLSAQSIMEEGTTFIIDHYDELSEKLGFTYNPPEILLEMLGEFTASQPQLSTEFLQLNTELYPKSIRAHRGLAEHYVSQNEVELGIESYQNALNLGAVDGPIKKIVEELKALEN